MPNIDRGLGKARTVLYVENGIGYGGATVCMRHLVRNLDRCRYRPVVVTGRSGPEYEGMADEAEWHYIRDRYVDTVSWRRWLEESGLSKLPILGWVLTQAVARCDDLCNFLPFFLRLLRLALKIRPDIVHANNEPLCNRAALLVAMLLRVPSVQHVRGGQEGSRLMAWSYRWPTHFIAVSHWISNGIGRLGVPEHKRSVIYDGIDLGALPLDTDRSPFRRRYGLGDTEFAVGLVGLLIPWKGQELFLDAARILREELPDLRMLIVGGTPEDCREYERALRRRVKEEGLETMVRFTGHQSNMPEVYNSLDVVVSASTSPEPLGTVVIEAMALGRPLIAPNHGGAAEMAEHEKTALLFEPGNAEDLAACIRRLYRDRELGVRLGASARAHALATFSVGEHAARVQEVYDRVLTGKPI